MKLSFSHSPVAATARSAANLRRRGIALVVTLILLSVITFLAVAFLFLSQRERGAVVTSVDMTTARLSAEAAEQRAEAELLARIIANTNQFDYGLMVSTNLINPLGFNPNAPVFNTLTNVNYDHDINGNPVTGNNYLQNLANLYYSPRPPVFVTTNRNRGLPLDFRYYLDLNRNGRFETNGLLPDLNDNGLPITAPTTNGLQVVSNFFVGDPEWIGLLEHPDRPHSSSNRFTARVAFFVVPSGLTLDVNRIHNQAKPLNLANNGFSRDMGVGTWEMDLAGFLVDLNTNAWPGQGVFGYTYAWSSPYVGSTGTAFDDARGIITHRYGGGLRTFGQLYPNGVTAFENDLVDGYGSASPLMTNTFLPAVDPDTGRSLSQQWPGAENPNHFFGVQDLFNRAQTRAPGQVGNTFSDRLMNAGYGTSSYNRYTYYRLLSQLGTDSGPEPAGKLNLNYVNVDKAGNTVPDLQTNFQPWTAVQFFTNAADRLLRASFPNAATNRQLFGINAALTITNVPVMISNQFVFTPALHRIFQLAANIYDASTNRTYNNATDYPFLPSVFRPRFRMDANGGFTDVYIDGWTEETGINTPTDYLKVPIDLNDTDPTSPSSLQRLRPDSNVYGVPWIIGAKKGFPSFNEFAMQSVAQITRKLQLRRLSTLTRPVATNQQFSVGISNVFAFELWNPYLTNYSRDVQVIVANDVRVGFTYTNDVPLDLRGGVSSLHLTVAALTNLTRNTWAGTGGDLTDATRTSASFKVPLQTNFLVQADAVYRTDSAGKPFFTPNTNYGVNVVDGFEQTQKFPIPQFGLAVSNRIRVILLDTATRRVIDYVQLSDLDGVRNMTRELGDGNILNSVGVGGVDTTEQGLWATNRIGGNSLNNPPEGVVNQLQASLGNINIANWNSYGQGQASGNTKQKAIDAFRVFMGFSPNVYFDTVNTNLVMQAPFTPTRKTSQYISWQANDPFVHYMAGDLEDLARGTGIRREKPNGPILPIPNIGQLNTRYEPWGGNPMSSANNSATQIPLFAPEAKDPGIRRPDDWDFPTNKFPTVGWLGRVHRGTPWQTVYLKANDVTNTVWAKWTGNPSRIDADLSRPVNDRVIFDVFTTALDENATRGQLNVNQTGLAAWSALLSGVIGLTNSSTDAELNQTPPLVRVDPVVIPPAGADAAGGTNAMVWKIWNGINRTRAAQPFNGTFKHLADVLATPELTVSSPLLNTNGNVQLQSGISDAVYERLPQMLMGLLRGNDQPRFTIYAYGQALHPADRSLVTTPGPFFRLCTNYQVTAEFATRTVVRIEGAPTAPRAVVESFNILPPDN